MFTISLHLLKTLRLFPVLVSSNYSGNTPQVLLTASEPAMFRSVFSFGSYFSLLFTVSNLNKPKACKTIAPSKGERKPFQNVFLITTVVKNIFLPSLIYLIYFFLLFKCTTIPTVPFLRHHLLVFEWPILLTTWCGGIELQTFQNQTFPFLPGMHGSEIPTASEPCTKGQKHYHQSKNLHSLLCSKVLWNWKSHQKQTLAVLESVPRDDADNENHGNQRTSRDD